MPKSRTIEQNIKLIEGLHSRLRLKEVIEDGEKSATIDSLFKDDDILSGLETAAKKLKTSSHEVKIKILRAFLSQIDFYGFANENVTYVDWCSGRGELAYTICHLIGSKGVRVDRKFAKRNIIEDFFYCTRQHNIPTVTLDLTHIDYDGNVPPIPRNTKGKVAYLGVHCCGSLTDLIARYGQLQKRHPDFIGILPCHHEKMDFKLSTLASELRLSREIFDVLIRAAGDLKSADGYHEAARKAVDIIDYYRAENLKLFGYDAKVIRLYPVNVSQFNHMIIGVKSR